MRSNSTWVKIKPDSSVAAYEKRHFLDCKSLAEMAITWVVLSIMFALPASAASLILGFILELPEALSRVTYIVLWLFPVVAMLMWFIRLGRSWKEPYLATKEFFYFQASAAIFMLVLGIAFPWAEVASSINAVRWFLSALIVMVNIAYMLLACGIRVRLPTKIFTGLILDIIVSLMPIWIK